MFNSLLRVPIAAYFAFLYPISCAITPLQENEIDGVVQLFMQGNQIPGVGLGIVYGNDTISKGYGFRNSEALELMTPNTRLFIASISKTFTATLVVKVLSEKFPEQGDRVLDVPIVELLPNGNFTFIDRFRSEAMSFTDLLSHRHGLETETLGSSAGAIQDLEEFTFRTRYATAIGPFREAGYYSNPLYALAGKLIAEIAGEPYEALMGSLLLDIGMTQTILTKPEENYDVVANVSKGYILKEEGRIVKLNMGLLNRVSVGVPAGGIISTPEDMTKYMQFHLNLGSVSGRQIVGKDAMQWMQKLVFVFDGLSYKQSETDGNIVQGPLGLAPGFQLGLLDGWMFQTHSGQFTPFMSQMTIFQHLKLGMFSINNGPFNLYESTFDHAELHYRLFGVIHGFSKSSTFRKSTVKSKWNAPSAIDRLDLSVGQINQQLFPGQFGNPIEGELVITTLGGTDLYMQYGTWATGYLRPYENQTNSFVLDWDADITHDIYFGTAGTLVDVYGQFTDENTFHLLFPFALIEFKRNVNLDSLPLIPWEPDSCM